MRPTTLPALAPAPAQADVIVIGAGAAGIAAARFLLAAGLSVTVLEARRRVGGRAVTVGLRGHPVDLGAHWLHAGGANPLMREAVRLGLRLRAAPEEIQLVRRGRPAPEAVARQFERVAGRADEALTRAASGRDRPASDVLPACGPWRSGIARHLGLVCGEPLGRVGLAGYPSLEFDANAFVAGGLGALVARSAANLPIRLGARVERLDLTGRDVLASGAFGTVSGRAAIVTLPVAVLARGGLTFAPELPPALSEAIAAFRPATYEHAVLSWPGSPFRGADRYVAFAEAGSGPAALLSRIDGGPFHYAELDETGLRGAERRGAAALVREGLASRFGRHAVRGLDVLTVTDWRHDPLGFGAWAVVPPGSAHARPALRGIVHDRLAFAGEAASREQWGTVGGAWVEGERAAGAILAALSPARAA